MTTESERERAESNWMKKKKKGARGGSLKVGNVSSKDLYEDGVERDRFQTEIKKFLLVSSLKALLLQFNLPSFDVACHACRVATTLDHRQPNGGHGK